MIDGWDICIDNIGDAMRKAKVLDIALQDQVYAKLSTFKPRPSIYDPDFIAANQVLLITNWCNFARPHHLNNLKFIENGVILHLFYIRFSFESNQSQHVQRTQLVERDTNNMNKFVVIFVNSKEKVALIR